MVGGTALYGPATAKTMPSPLDRTIESQRVATTCPECIPWPAEQRGGPIAVGSHCLVKSPAHKLGRGARRFRKRQSEGRISADSTFRKREHIGEQEDC